jgi:putative tricarboxylic transport membrane protein
MRPYQQLAGLLFAGLGVFLMMQGTGLKLEGEFGPGPGFMAFVVGIMLLGTSLLWVLSVSLSPSVPFASDALPDRRGLANVLLTVAALLGLAALLTAVGFRLGIFGFLLVVLFVFGRDHPLLKVAVALVFSFGLYELFERVLRVPLPRASIEALAALGL